MMNDVVTGLALAGKLSEVMRNSTSDSLIEYTKPTRVEPLVLMDARVTKLEVASDIMQSLTSLFSGYYLQAVALSVNVGRVDVVRLLDKLNPQRSVKDNLINGISDGVSLVLEDARSYSFRLPVPGKASGLEKLGVSMEALTVRDMIKNAAESKPDPETETMGLGRDAVASLSDLTNLSVGKMLEVHVESEGHKATFPINVRLICTGIGSSELVHILSVGNKKITVKERFHAWRAGQLEFVRDLVMCQDLIDAHKKTLAKDTSGLYEEIRNRRRGNSLSAIFSGQPSVATASNLIVIASNTARELERNVGGRLKDVRTRNKVFQETYCMILCVVDADYEMVTMYHRGIAVPTELSFKELKISNSKKGPDVAEIMKAYQMGASPSI